MPKAVVWAKKQQMESAWHSFVIRNSFLHLGLIPTRRLITRERETRRSPASGEDLAVPAIWPILGSLWYHFRRWDEHNCSTGSRSHPHNRGNPALKLLPWPVLKQATRETTTKHEALGSGNRCPESQSPKAHAWIPLPRWHRHKTLSSLWPPHTR